MGGTFLKISKNYMIENLSNSFRSENKNTTLFTE